MDPKVVVLLLATVALAGCTGSDGPAEDGVQGPGAADGGGGHMMSSLQFAPGAHAATDSFSGSFAFEENDQFMGELQRQLGRDPANVRSHDISSLLPSDGLYRIEVQATADPAGGDIDVWLMDQGDLITWSCDCPFGGDNTLSGYGMAGGGGVSLHIQYDEISSGPDDFQFALQGFDYSIDVTVTAAPDMIPPGVPLAVRLPEVGDHIMFEGHQATIVVFGPDDTQVAVLDPSDTTFTVEEGMRTGEYVFMQRLDGAPFTAMTNVAMDGVRPYRLLDLSYDSGGMTFSPGSQSRVPFDVPSNVIEIGGCGFATEVSMQPSFRVADPNGETWSGSASDGLAIGGWGSCHSNWPGTPDQIIGEYAVEFLEAAGGGVELVWWVGTYQR